MKSVNYITSVDRFSDGEKIHNGVLRVFNMIIIVEFRVWRMISSAIKGWVA